MLVTNSKYLRTSFCIYIVENVLLYWGSSSFLLELMVAVAEVDQRISTAYGCLSLKEEINMP